MLREEASQLLRVGRHLDVRGLRAVDVVAPPANKMNLVVREDAADRFTGLVDHPRVAQVEADPQPVNATTVLRDAPVAQIDAEQVDVLGWKLAEVVLVSAATCAGRLPAWGGGPRSSDEGPR
jgi:hypothetical protein